MAFQQGHLQDRREMSVGRFSIRFKRVQLHQNPVSKGAIKIKAKPPQTPVRTILLVDGRADCRITTKWFLANFGYEVDSVRSGEEALALFNPKIHDLVITDNSMDGMNGAELAHVVKLRSPTTPVIMYTKEPPEDHTCLDMVVKRPTHLLVLREAVEKLLTAQHA